MNATMSPNDHERAEWARMANDAYKHNRNSIGHRYSAASAVGGPMPLARFDSLQRDYRSWLIDGWSGFDPEPPEPPFRPLMFVHVGD